MKAFMDENFLLSNTTAEQLYHEFAKNMPIYDYHCHLSPADIANDRQFSNLGELWLEGDHYKWRILRAAGVEERLITGDASTKEKYLAWAKILPKCIGNPAYHWAHLELKNPFGISNTLFSPSTAEDIWRQTEIMLKEPDFSVRGILKKMNVHMIGTTDDPTHSLEHHRKIQQDESFNIKVSPSWRPDNIFKLNKPDYKDYIHALEKTSDVDIHSMESLFRALEKRLDTFSELGCLSADHGIEIVRFAALPHERDLDQIFIKALTNKKITELESAQFFTALLLWLAEQYENRGWVMQLHIGPLRNTSTRMLKTMGPDAGCDSIGDKPFAQELAKLLNAMDVMGRLPKTILYHINPAANEVLASMIGNFQGGTPGKIQFGSAWWFNDQKDGMQRQLEQLAQMGLLSQFVGMLTDSRSFLSYSRHEYFRRILCNKIGTWVDDGEAPYDLDLLGGMVQDICFNNARSYFEGLNLN